jgi:hypothetical protein
MEREVMCVRRNHLVVVQLHFETHPPTHCVASSELEWTKIVKFGTRVLDDFSILFDDMSVLHALL